MALYAIGDLHISLTSDKPMDVFGGGWTDYMKKIEAGFSILNKDDICVLCGDSSWGMTLAESIEDLKYISGLPGRKIILKGNHDYWWDTVTKINAALEKNGIDNISILHNNCFFYNDAAICGTRGWIAENELDREHGKKILAREAARLRASLAAAGDASEKLCFLHYPPRYNGIICSEIIDVMREFDVKRCWYGHIHGRGHRGAVRGEVEGIRYELISADFVGFVPQRIM